MCQQNRVAWLRSLTGCGRAPHKAEVYRQRIYVTQLNSNKQSACVFAHMDSADDSLAPQHCAGLCTAKKQ